MSRVHNFTFEIVHIQRTFATDEIELIDLGIFADHILNRSQDSQSKEESTACERAPGRCGMTPPSSARIVVCAISIMVAVPASVPASSSATARPIVVRAMRLASIALYAFSTYRTGARAP